MSFGGFSPEKIPPQRGILLRDTGLHALDTLRAVPWKGAIQAIGATCAGIPRKAGGKMSDRAAKSHFVLDGADFLNHLPLSTIYIQRFTCSEWFARSAD